MFESAELGHEIDHERYAADEPRVRRALLAAQYEIVKLAAFPVVILIAGVDGAGKGDTVNMLNEWMDPRHIQTNAMRPVVDPLDGRPPMWRFWSPLPPSGRFAIFVGSWYSQPLVKRVYREIDSNELDRQITGIKRFEQMLTDEGTLLIKFWLHLSKDQQRKRFEKFSKRKKTAWRVRDTDWKHLKHYKRFVSVAHHLIRDTSTPDAPWIVLEGNDDRYRNLTVATTILAALKQRLEATKVATAEKAARAAEAAAAAAVVAAATAAAAAAVLTATAAPVETPPTAATAAAAAAAAKSATAATAATAAATATDATAADAGPPGEPMAESEEIEPTRRQMSIDGISVLDRLELDQVLDKKAYRDQLECWQGRLNLATQHRRFDKISVIAAFEGCDAAGKGGAIRRVTQALDARNYDVIPVGPPTDEEKTRPYLWRFWRHLPARGRMKIFDRSWYGRVLVERVEGYCEPRDWARAYGEINDFETELVTNDTVLVKFWLQISKDEQLRRFEERVATPHKQHKITNEDWRNRERWDDYYRAVSEMFERTSSEHAPWTLVEANNKYFARVKVLRTLVHAIEAML